MSIGPLGLQRSPAIELAERWRQPAPSTDNPDRKSDTTAIVAARAALARANAQVDVDKRNNSPDCVACDQKLVDKAAQTLAQAKTAAGGTLAITL